MIARWCISAFIFLLTLFGVISQQQIAVPNQEIILQFSDIELTSEDAKHTILIVRKQLEALGVENIQIKSQGNGKLKISYYCDADISSIKNSFAKAHNLDLNYQSGTTGRGASEFPSPENSIAYNINVYEIQSSSDSGWDFDGAFTLEVEVKSDRFLDPNINFSAGNLELKRLTQVSNVAFRVQKNVSVAIRETLHTIPEVRAGPLL
ncbi:hypothetical protein [uncultured Algibacter sp.]|uniref:hypothetical protein n=1 Tax=uncultured Algibacter sp. TaxID=298659 RepID=UPI0026320ECC|nr:hypothetical protein [uncultured Algibacter sp.]